MADQPAVAVSWRHLGWMALIIVCLIFGSLLAGIETSSAYLFVLICAAVNVVLVFKYPFWGLLLYTIVFLFRPGEVYPSIAVIRPGLLTGGLAVLSVVFHQVVHYRRVTLPKDRITLALALFLVAMYLSVFTSFEATQTVYNCVTFFKILIFYYLIVSLVDSRKRLAMFLVAFVIMIAYIGADAFNEYLAGNFVRSMDMDRLVGSTSAGGDPNTLATTLSTAIPLFFALGFYSRNWLAKTAFFCLGLGIVPLVAITGSRGGVLALAAVALGGVWLTRYKLPLLIMVISLGIGGWFVLPKQYQDRYARFSEVTQDLDKASSGRWSIWQRGVKMFLQRPIIGVGAGAFVWANGSGDFGPPSSLHAHNVIIQTAATTGIIGLTVWLAFLILLFGQLRRLIAGISEHPEQRWIRLFANGFLVTLTSLLVVGMFGHNLYRYTWYIVAALVVALSNQVAGKAAPLQKADIDRIPSNL